MNTSTNKNTNILKPGGLFADVLTLIRFGLTPLIMLLIIFTGWPDIYVSIIVFGVFVLAALTDILDDLIGGAAISPYRKFGWFDDIADILLVTGTLIAIGYVIWRQNPDNFMSHWMFIIPTAFIIVRDVVICIVKGFELSQQGWQRSPLGDFKMAVIMLGVCILLASPWLSAWLETMLANDDNLLSIYSQTTNYIWGLGLGLLWLGACLSLVTGIKLLNTKHVN